MYINIKSIMAKVDHKIVLFDNSQTENNSGPWPGVNYKWTGLGDHYN